MANISTHVPITETLMGAVVRFFTALGNTMVRIGESNSKMQQVQALSALSDGELAARGLRREDIARRVFSDAY